MKLLLDSREWAIARKDLKNVWYTKMARLTILLVPILLCLFLPAVYVTVIALVPEEELAEDAREIAAFFAGGEAATVRQLLFSMIGQMLGPLFFLMVPLLSSTTAAACSFVGEREHSTMETLLLAPVTLQQIFWAKVAACFLLSVVVELVSLLSFSAVMAVGSIVLEAPFYFNGNWAVLVFLLCPLFTVLGVIFMVLVSGKSKNAMEATQTSGYLVLPVILLFVGQFSGLFPAGPLYLLIAAAVVAAADAVLLRFASRAFTPEKLLR